MHDHFLWIMWHYRRDSFEVCHYAPLRDLSVSAEHLNPGSPSSVISLPFSSESFNSEDISTMGLESKESKRFFGGFFAKVGFDELIVKIYLNCNTRDVLHLSAVS